MPTQIVPPPVLIDQQVIYWPGPRREGTFSGMTNNGSYQYDPGAINFLVMGSSGTWNSRVFPAATGRLVGLLGNAGAGNSFAGAENTIGAMPLTLARASNAWPASSFGREDLRVMRCTFFMAAIGTNIANIDDQHGCVFRPEAGTAGGVPPLGNAGFGICGDGAGAWTYRNYQAGAFPGNIAESVAIPGLTITDLNFFDFEFINGSPNRDASMSLEVNGTAIVSRNWVSGGVTELADYSLGAGGLGSCIHGPHWYTLEATTPNIGIQLGDITWYRGRFTRAGVEITD